LDEYAETRIAQRISMISGVAQVQVLGAQKYAVHVQMDPHALASRQIGFNEIEASLKNWNVNLPTGAIVGPQRAFTLQASGQLLTAKEYKDIVEDERARTDKTTEEILAEIDEPELTKLCVVKCIDDGDEDVHCRINRFDFNRFADRLETLRTNGKDVLIVKGRKRDGFGTNILVKEMWGLCLD